MFVGGFIVDRLAIGEEHITMPNGIELKPNNLRTTMALAFNLEIQLN